MASESQHALRALVIACPNAAKGFTSKSVIKKRLAQLTIEVTSMFRAQVVQGLHAMRV